MSRNVNEESILVQQKELRSQHPLQMFNNTKILKPPVILHLKFKQLPRFARIFIA